MPIVINPSTPNPATPSTATSSDSHLTVYVDATYCGVLLKAQRRHPNRPAHLHFMVSKPGFKVLVSQVYADDDENLESDPTFGVTRRLIGRYAMQPDGQSATLAYDFRLEPGETKFPRPPIP